MNATISHDDLMRKLAAYLRGNGDRMVWEDMQLGPSGSPRPDVYTLLKSYSRPLPTAYECKISVADFRSDVTSGKWQKYLQFAGAVIFCTPKGLVQKTDIPDGCGLVWYYPESGAFKTIKGPTFRAVVLPQDALLKLLIDGLQRIQKSARDTYASEFIIMRKVRATLGSQIADYLQDKKTAEAKLESLKLLIAQRQKDWASIDAACKDKEDQAYRSGSERLEADRKAIDAEWDNLWSVLGLQGERNRWTIHGVIQNLRQSLTEAAEVRRLQGLMADIARVINHGAQHPAGTVQAVEVTR